MVTACAQPAVDPRILERLHCPLSAIVALCEKYRVSELSVFGSVVREDFKDASSDIDFLYVFQPDATPGFFKFFDLHEELQGLIGRKIDLVSKEWLRPRFRERVLPEAKVLYAA